MHDHAHCTVYDRAYFVGLIFMVSQLFVKIGPLENFHCMVARTPACTQQLESRSHDTTALILYYGWGVRVYLAATPVLPCMATSNNSIIIITLRKLTFIHT